MLIYWFFIIFSPALFLIVANRAYKGLVLSELSKYYWFFISQTSLLLAINFWLAYISNDISAENDFCEVIIFQNTIYFCFLELLALIFGIRVDVRKIKKRDAEISKKPISEYIAVSIIVTYCISAFVLMAYLEFGASLTTILFIVLIPIIIFIPAYRSNRKYRKWRFGKNETHDFNSLETTNAPILFLRSFELGMVYNDFGITFDENLCHDFPIKENPVIALADPSQHIYCNTSIKLQTSDEGWKDVIAELFKGCRAVIMFEGKTDGLNWEIENIKNFIPHDRFFVAIPEKLYRKYAWHGRSMLSGKKNKVLKAFKYVWNNFSSRLNKSGIYLPQDVEECGRLYAFDANWCSKEPYENLSGSDYLNKVMELTENLPSRTFDYTAFSRRHQTNLISHELPMSQINRAKRFTYIATACNILIAIGLIYYYLK